MAAERVANSFAKLNLSAIKKCDQYVVNIVDNASQVALYKFNGENQAWEKTEVEGALFVYSRSVTPTSAFFIMNRLNMNNMMEPITNSMEFKLQDPFLLYKNNTKGIFGIWFYDRDECRRLANLMKMLSSQTGVMGSPVVVNPPSTPEMRKESQTNASEEKVDIMQLFAKAQERFDNQSKTSSPSSAAASHPSNTSQKQQVPQEQREQQQKFLQQNQLQTEQLQKLFQIPDSQPKKQRTYSSPAPYLSSPSSMGKGTPKGEVQENGVLPGGEGQSSKRMEKVKSLPLSDIKAPTCSVGSVGSIARTKDDSSTENGKPGAQRKLFQNEKKDAKSADTLATQSPVASQNTAVSQAKDSPQKPSQDQGGTVGASLMSPLAFQPSGKVAILTPQSQPKSLPKMEIAPLTQDQLVQALTYLLKNDSEFVSKIHEAYFKSLQDKLPT